MEQSSCFMIAYPVDKLSKGSAAGFYNKALPCLKKLILPRSLKKLN
eukprot:XP_001710056.1 Hypothetical protein GL50803_35012 [Giardia lamblia ATCC 50803]